MRLRRLQGVRRPFGHLFYKTFTNIDSGMEYRFVGEQCPGGPGWAFRNSGVMIHCQDPASMGKDQDFPVSIEVQYLGGDGRARGPPATSAPPARTSSWAGSSSSSTASSRPPTPSGTTSGCRSRSSRTAGKIKHLINGKTVIEYEKPQLDDSSPEARELIREGNGEVMIPGGYIALQSESHPIEFRKIEILPLDE